MNRESSYFSLFIVLSIKKEFFQNLVKLKDSTNIFTKILQGDFWGNL